MKKREDMIKTLKQQDLRRRLLEGKLENQRKFLDSLQGHRETLHAAGLAKAVQRPARAAIAQREDGAVIMAFSLVQNTRDRWNNSHRMIMQGRGNAAQIEGWQLRSDRPHLTRERAAGYDQYAHGRLMPTIVLASSAVVAASGP